jgi:hypothetical protein
LFLAYLLNLARFIAGKTAVSMALDKIRIL